MSIFCKQIKPIFLGFIFLFLLVNITNGQENIHILKPDQLYLMIQKNQNLHLFDIRTKELYSKERIQNAICVDNKNRFKIYLKELDINDSIFIYCEMGKRTKECSNWLKSIGFKKVFELEGGFKEWKKCGLPSDSSKLK